MEDRKMTREEAASKGRQNALVAIRVLKEQRIERYNKNPKRCKFCNQAFSYKNRKKTFCNHSHASSFNNKGKRKHGNPINPNKTCFNCGSKCCKSSCKFCCISCRKEFSYKQQIEKWICGKIKGQDKGKNNSVKLFVRKWLLDRSNNKCEKCGWSETNLFTNKIPLTVHHKDGNSENTIPENVEIICPNCHSLTQHYGGANKGSGRKKRYNASVT